MTHSALRYLSLGLMVSIAFGGTALAKETSASLKISLRAYNNASVPQKTLIEAQTEVSRIFAKIGVRAMWADSSAFQADGPYEFTIAVIIVGRSAAALLPRSEAAMGSTPQGEESTQGRVTYIFYDRVEDFTHDFQARSVATTNAHTLAYTIAHEIGHLLLPLEPHSQSGLMRCSWERDDFKQMLTGELSFTRVWAELIRDAVLRRAVPQVSISDPR